MADKTPAAQNDQKSLAPAADITSAMKRRLPKTVDGWASAVKKAQVHGTIHTFKAVRSASKIEFPQYLLLRTLWSYDKIHSTRSIARPPALTKYLRRENITVAEDLLSRSSDWAHYLASIRDNAMFSPGSMGLVRYYQYLCTQVKTTPDCGGIDKINNSPITLRPRKPVNYAAASSTDSASGSPGRPPVTTAGSPTHPPAVGDGDAAVVGWVENTSAVGASLPDPPSTPENLIAGIESLTIGGGAGRRQRTESNYSSNPDTDLDPESDSPEKNRAVKDEQIVNTALIILLNVLTLAFDQAQGEWSLYRQPFCVRDRNGKKVYEARVDGVYTIGEEEEIVSIAEVKPYSRKDKDEVNIAVSMQETAQMAAWISQHPPETAKTDPPQHVYRRLLLSQDKDEVFCTIASFKPAYVRYIRDQMGDTQSQEDDFLRMDQQGPFRVDSERHMALLGKLLLAYMIQGALEEI